jgi:hypothetical protein
MTFLFLQGKKSKEIHRELSGALAEAAVRLATVKSWCRVLQRRQLFTWWRILFWAFVQSHWGAISQFFSKDSFLSARILAKRLTITSRTIKETLTSDLGMRKFTRKWMTMTRVTGIRENEPLICGWCYRHWEKTKARTFHISWLETKASSTTPLSPLQYWHAREMKLSQKCHRRRTRKSDVHNIFHCQTIAEASLFISRIET